jgi:hypothetical protein
MPVLMLKRKLPKSLLRKLARSRVSLLTHEQAKFTVICEFSSRVDADAAAAQVLVV